MSLTAEQKRQRREDRKALGVCTECGRRKPSVGFAICEACGKQARKPAAKWNKDHTRHISYWLYRDRAKVRILIKPWRDEGRDQPIYEGLVNLVVQPVEQGIVIAWKPLFDGWLPKESVPMKVNLVLGPGWSHAPRQ